MFNTYNTRQSVTNHTEINTDNHNASNIMSKSMQKSKFKRFERGSRTEQTIFSDEPHLTKTVLERYNPYEPAYEVEEKNRSGCITSYAYRQ